MLPRRTSSRRGQASLEVAKHQFPPRCVRGRIFFLCGRSVAGSAESLPLRLRGLSLFHIRACSSAGSKNRPAGMGARSTAGASRQPNSALERVCRCGSSRRVTKKNRPDSAKQRRGNMGAYDTPCPLFKSRRVPTAETLRYPMALFSNFRLLTGPGRAGKPADRAGAAARFWGAR